jgi:hypothetical protein
VNASETEGACSRPSFAQPDSVSTPLCQRASNFVPLLPRFVRTDSKMGELIGSQFVIFTTSAFLRRSMSAMAVRSGPPPAERQVIEPFARVTEPAHQI